MKVLDPDGNTVLIGREEQPESQPPAGQAGTSRFSLLTEAAALVEARGGTTLTYQVPSFGGVTCQNKADVKLADSGGDTVWACVGHADEILVAVPGAFIAAQDAPGIGSFLNSRRSRPPAPAS